MAEPLVSPGPRLLQMWRRLAPLPGGRWLFGVAFSHMVPYSGSIRPRVLDLEPGRSRVELRDRRRVRNHLASIHAIALANLGEMTTGLAVVTHLAPTIRAILVGLDVVYQKKARGSLVAECRATPPTPTDDSVEYDAMATIRNQDQESVCLVRARWRLSPAPKP